MTLSIYENPDAFRIGSICADKDYSHLRWTVDTRRDLELINQILDLSKIEAGAMERHVGDFDLRELVESISAIFRRKQFLIL